MTTFIVPQNQQKLLRIAFVLGPFLLVLSALSFVLGIGLIPPGITSFVEGIFGSFALILFVPVYLQLSAMLSRTHKILGSVTSVTGLAGAVVGFSMEFMRVIEYSLRQYGAGDGVWASFYGQPNAEFLLIALMGPLFPITSVLLGIGFWQAKSLPRWIAACLLAAGIGFPLAQVLELEWAPKVTYPMACILWLLSLSVVGLRFLSDKQPAAASAPATISPA
ncbi:MAG: hypothetical protein IT259_00400 [Saprospiraceae bacterium]|nr:hypothetical protein [Saprospiraceae bacterium]